MASSGGLPSDQAKVVAAARAAASWARARRALWTDAPLPPVEGFDEELPAAPPPLPAPPPPAVQKPTGPSAATRLLGGLRGAAGPVLRWVPRLAIAAGLVYGAVVGYPYVLKMIPTSTKTADKSDAAKDPNATTGIGTGPATLKLKTDPPGAQVLLDGKPRGITPTTLNDVPPGKHTVLLKHKDGTITRTITVEAGETADIDEQIFAGFVAIYSPIEVTISEGGRTLRPDDRSQVMLPPGMHDLRLVNKTLAYESLQKVEVKPGEVTRVNVTPPRGSLSVTASEPAEVLVDGTKVGDAPLNDVAIDLGTHEVLVKRVGGGERRYTVTATAKPTIINVDFAKP